MVLHLVSVALKQRLEAFRKWPIFPGGENALNNTIFFCSHLRAYWRNTGPKTKENLAYSLLKLA